ncbi:MAG TPA: CDP-diacylglycerol--glycerol-3-phosphate 3-phosphatidyltransferase [Burkholderiales bacterium]|nr:CDP-diacylglycerol--glycerol-3-phosphate 3-phosphatidyltransferase [Burkholderiales bacterium]
MPFNVPNLLTWLRIFLIPLLVLVYYLPHDWMPTHNRNILATAIFVLAAATDWLDGWLARTLKQTSLFGAFLDPVADKLMVSTALVMLVWLARCEAFIAAIIIGREIAISALREWMAKVGQSRSVAVSMVGKLKTLSQMIAIALLLYHDPLLGLSAHRIGTWLIYLAALLTLWSMIYYLRRAIPELLRQ